MMKKPFKRSIQFTGVAAICAAAFTVTLPAKHQISGARSASDLLRGLKPSVIEKAAADAGATAIGNLFRNMAFMIVGYPDDAAYNELVPDGDGPPRNGMIGLINDIMGESGAGALLKGKYSACAELPATGAESTTFKEDDGSESTMAITFATPQTLIPSRYSGAGGTYQKKLSLNLNGVTVFSYEFDCDSPRGVADFNFPEDQAQTQFRKIRLVFDASDSSVKADFGMYFDGADDQRFALRLDGSADGTFDLHFSSVSKDGSGQYEAIRASAKGNAGDKMTGFLHHMKNLGGSAAGVTDTSTSLADGDGAADLGTNDADLLFCYDFNAKSAELGACSGLALSSPPTEAYPSATAAYTMAGLASANFTGSF